MTTKRIVYTKPDGTVCVVVPAPDFVAGFQSEADAMAAIREKDVPEDAENVMECDAADLPSDRTQRSAWVCDGRTVSIDQR